jgi:hypothetical protein
MGCLAQVSALTTKVRAMYEEQKTRRDRITQRSYIRTQRVAINIT